MGRKKTIKPRCDLQPTPDEIEARLHPRTHPNPELYCKKLPDGVPATNPWYWTMRQAFRMTLPLLWKVRVYNRHFEPTSGGTVYICNHQSFLDPMLMGFALRRPMNFMARDSLFKWGPLRKWITSVNAFPVKRGTADLGAIKEAMRRLKAGGQVVLFAEGTRTTDGRIANLLPGVAMLAQRAAKWTIPVVIDGAFEAYPRDSLLPNLGKIIVQYAKPLSQAEAKSFEPHDLMDHARKKMIEIQSDIRKRAGKEPLKY
ncbi:MAG TPA: 1-acyl-sn-glycerol-3-phosphate acyltransferase [Phycisphaerae bacterium]|nr:1-acyl-sn-glycerol-3-phosphate acyltransferase [Phycisphaerae bacterium]